MNAAAGVFESKKPGLYIFSFSVHARFPETTGTRQKFVLFFMSPTRSTTTSFCLTFNTHYECRDSTISFSVQIYYTSPRKEPFCTPTVRTVTPNSAGGYWKKSRCIHRRTFAIISHRLADWHEISIWTHIQLATEL